MQVQSPVRQKAQSLTICLAFMHLHNLGNTAETLIDHPLAAYLGVIDSERNIDITKVCEFMRMKMPREGLKVPVANDWYFEF